MFRLSQTARRKDSLALAVCVVLSLTLLFLPDEVQLTAADRLRQVLTGPYWQMRDLGEDVIRVRRENERLQAALAELKLSAAATERAELDAKQAGAVAVLEGGFQDRLLPCEVVARRRGRFARMIKIRSVTPIPWKLFQPVITPAGLLGRVHWISGPRSAWVELLSAPDTAIGCEVDRTGLLGVLRSSAGKFVLDMVGRDEDVQKGDRVITSGIAEIRDEEGDDLAPGLMPRGLPVGIVSSVSSPVDELFKKITVEPHASFRYHETVFVVDTGPREDPGGEPPSGPAGGGGRR